MFEYLFPIFAFGLVVTGIVFKGVLAAADVAKADRLAKELDAEPDAETTEAFERIRSGLSF